MNMAAKGLKLVGAQLCRVAGSAGSWRHGRLWRHVVGLWRHGRPWWRSRTYGTAADCLFFGGVFALGCGG